MNKEDFIIILQSALFSFDGSNEKEIQELNSDYDLKLIKTGIKLCQYLKK